jgi:hypothetical protein
VDLEVRTLIFSVTRFVRRGALFSLLAAMAAGCSASNAPGLAPGSSSVQSDAQHQSAAMERKLANGLLRRAGTANHAHGWMSPDAKHAKDLFYWADFDSNTVNVYEKNGVNPKEVGTITDGIDEPERLFVDASKNLWATEIGSETVNEYAKGATSPSFTISTGIGSPTGLTVDSAGTVYVANVASDTVTEYPKGETSPSLTIPISTSPEYLATDSSDNLYVSTGLGVWEFPPGSTTGSELDLSMGSPSGIEVDKSGNIIVIDSTALTIDVFPPGQSTPSEQIPDSPDDPFALSLSKSDKKLYVSAIDATGDFIVQQLLYPNGTSLTNKLTTDAGQWPIAVSPDNVL